MNRTVCKDDQFGPVVHGCRDDFDFTLLFENTILSIAPTSFALLVAAGRIIYLYSKPKLLLAKQFQYTKLIALALYAVLQVALVALWAIQPGLRSSTSILAGTISLLSAFVFCSLSYLEHARSIQPSTTLIVYMLVSTIFDIARSRTLWLIAPESSLTRLFTASVVFKALVLVLESGEKAKYLPEEVRRGRPEETSSILNRSVFYWINHLMIQGARRLLGLEDLYELNVKFTADHLMTAYINNWQRAIKHNKNTALWMIAKTLRWQILAVIFPRVVLLILTMCQPLLIQELLTFLADESSSPHTGYGLIGAYAFVYIGTAVSTGFYWYFQYQFMTMVRGCLVSAISWQTARLNLQSVEDPKAAVTLMSTDVERITNGLRPMHDFWASLIQIGIALYLLQRQMGVACVVPIIICILCGVSTASISPYTNRKQIQWMEAVQVRIGLTAATLSSMKGVKMRGLINVLTQKIHESRLRELRQANAWRRVILATITTSFIPEYLSPPATFLIYIIQARAKGEVFDASRAFTTLSLLTVIAQPMNNLIQSTPDLVGAIGCCQRISEFLCAEEQMDFRDVEGYDLERVMSQSLSQALDEDPESIEMATSPTKPLTNQPAKGQPIIQITEANFGWTKDKDILKDINITIPSGRLTCLVGPIASGKSTFLKALLGETRASKGQVEMYATSREVAFCDQTAHLINGTIKENIVGFSGNDEAWYTRVVHACALTEDIAAMPKQHETSIGSGGVNLSGGQRQKVAIARALYSRKAILILDDVFSGFDAGSEQHVFRHVVGPDGLAQKQGMSVIFATHAIKFLPYCDHIIALGLDGRVAQEGSYQNLKLQPGYVQGLAVDDGPQGAGTAATDLPLDVEKVKVEEDIAEQDLLRSAGDLKIYRYYFSAAGFWPTFLIVVSSMGVSVFFNLPTYWLKLWTDASTKHHNYDEYMYLGVYSAMWLLALACLSLLAYETISAMATSSGKTLHFRLLRTVGNASMLLFSTTDSGSITNRFSQDIGLVDSQLPLGMVNLAFGAFVCAGQITLIVASSPWVGLAFPLVFVVFYIVQKFYLRTSRQLRFLDLEAKSPLYTNFLETLSGLSTIRSFGWTKQNLALNRKLLDRSQKPNYLLYMIQRWLTFVLDMLVAFLAVIIATIAITQRSNGGFAGVALTQVMLVNLTLRSLIVAWTDVETSIGAVSRIKSFEETTASEHRAIESSDPGTSWPQHGRVEFEAVTAIYGTAPDNPALKKFDLMIQPGEKIGVCGRSGSGKSSLVLALFRMLEIQSGNLKIDGLDLKQIPRDTVRERLNVIPQEPLILPGTVRFNLDPRQEHSNAELVEALKKVRLWTIFEAEGGLDGEIGSDLLSHGQRQLFCLAAAILRKSKIVVLDEPSSNVDHETDEVMQHIIRKEFKGCTIIAVAHRLNTIMDFDRIAVLDHGVLQELDSPQALLSRDSRFKSMWGERKSRESK